MSKKFGATYAVRELSLSVARGEILGFLGPNGAGKTTTMRLITGYLAPDRGSIKVGSYRVAENPLAVKRMIGYLPEDNPLYPFFRVGEYLQFIAGVRGVEKGTAFDELVARCGLKEVWRQNINTLSKGYRQRVGLAAALLHDPALLILDEPTSGLDPNQILEIRQLIKELGEKKTVILSTHILSEVEATCSRIVIINRGRLVAEGTLKELTRGGRKKLEDVFHQLTQEEEDQDGNKIKNET